MSSDLDRSATTPRRSRRTLDWLLVVAPVLPLLCAAGVLWSTAAKIPALADRLVAGDGALLELGVRRAAGFEQLVGCYSRFGFHHPGPLHYYLLAPVYSLAGGASWSLYFGTALLAAGFLGVALWLTWRACGRAATLALAVVLCLWQLQVGAEQLAPWEPGMGRPALVALLAATLALRRSVPGASWVVVFAGSYALQAHLSFLPVVGVCWVTAAVLLAVRPAALRRRGELPGAVGLAVLLWLPVLVDQLRHGADGNLARILHGFAERGVERGYLEALQAVAPRLVWWSEPSPWAVVLLATQVLGLTFAAWWSWRRRGLDVACLMATVSLVLHGAALVGARRVPGEIPAHALAFAELLVLPLPVLAATAIAEWLGARPLRRGLRLGLAWTTAGLLVIGLEAARRALLAGVAGILFNPGVALPEDLRESLTATAANLRAEQIEAVSVQAPAPALFPVLAGVVLGLRKAGLAATGGGEFAFIFSQLDSVDDAVALELRPYAAGLERDERCLSVWPSLGIVLWRSDD